MYTVLHTPDSSCMYKMASIMKPKRAHKILTVNQKLKLLMRSERKSNTMLYEDYGTGWSTITDIKRCESEHHQPEAPN